MLKTAKYSVMTVRKQQKSRFLTTMTSMARLYGGNEDAKNIGSVVNKTRSLRKNGR